MSFFRGFAGFLTCITFSSPLFANTSSTNELFELSFEELLDVNIELATKTDETRASVPSSITVFNKQHIRLLGIKNAYDLMNFVPGFQNTRGDWVGAVPKEHTRGVYLDSGNVLVMINGQRINESSFGKASVYTPFIPVEVIERVEFIRGPGSALYGSNAFLGVMNIVTKKADNQITLSLGEHGFRQYSFNGSTSLNSDITAYTNIALVKQTGEQYFNGQVRDPLNAEYFEFGLNSKKIALSLRHYSNELNQFINLAGVSPNNLHRSENRSISLTYHWLNNDSLDISTRIYKIVHEIQSAGLIAPASVLPAGDFFVGPAWASSDFNLSTDVAYQWSEDTTVNAGVEISRAKQTEANVLTSYFDFGLGDIAISSDSYLGEIKTISNYQRFQPLKQDFNSKAAYAQVKQRVNERFTLFVGARYDKVEDIDKKISPRLAAIYSFDNENTFKVQYGESFRTPVSNELNSNDDVTVGNKNLVSESIKTTELVWHWQSTKRQFDVVLFNNDLSNFINLIPIDIAGSRFRFENAFSNSMQGLELNGNVTITEQSWFEFGYTQLFDEPFNPSFKRFATAAWKQQLGDLQVSVNANWRDSVEVSAGDSYFNQSAYTLFGSTVIWPITPSHQLRVEAQNLLDKQYNVFDPRMPDGAVPGAGRQIRLSYTFKF